MVFILGAKETSARYNKVATLVFHDLSNRPFQYQLSVINGFLRSHCTASLQGGSSYVTASSKIIHLDIDSPARLGHGPARVGSGATCQDPFVVALPDSPYNGVAYLVFDQDDYDARTLNSVIPAAW